MSKQQKPLSVPPFIWAASVAAMAWLLLGAVGPSTPPSIESGGTNTIHTLIVTNISVENMYVSNVVVTNLTANVINVTSNYVTQQITTNLYSTTITSVTNYFTETWITNLYVDNSYHTNVTVYNTFNVKGKATFQGGIDQWQWPLTHAGTVTLNFGSTQNVAYVAATGNLALAFSNVASNRPFQLLIKNGQATNITVTWPSGIHGYYSTTVSNATWMMASMLGWGTGDTNVWVSTSNDGTY